MKDEGDGVSGDAKAAVPRLERSTPGGREADRPVILYDGWCNLCDSSVAFVLSHDRAAHFRFAALQSPAAAALLVGCPSKEHLERTMVLVESGRCRTRSEAVLAILGRLPAPWRWLQVLTIVPRPVRDRVYDLIARHRTTWFGRTRICMTSMNGARDRFLD